MPTFFMVALSWISFLIPPNCYPGRISLLVTIVLCIINVMTSSMQNSPESNGLNAMNCWFLICLVLVAIASLEYAVIIYFMRFSKKVERLEKVRCSNNPIKKDFLEFNHVWANRANLIDHFSLLIIPSLFFLMILVYFIVYLSSPNCDNFNQKTR